MDPVPSWPNDMKTTERQENNTKTVLRHANEGLQMNSITWWYSWGPDDHTNQSGTSNNILMHFRIQPKRTSDCQAWEERWTGTWTVLNWPHNFETHDSGANEFEKQRATNSLSRPALWCIRNNCGMPRTTTACMSTDDWTSISRVQKTLNIPASVQENCIWSIFNAIEHRAF